VFDGNKSLDIDSLENGLLLTSYPAIRHALATHLADEVEIFDDFRFMINRNC